jgi:hypothetical protein
MRLRSGPRNLPGDDDTLPDFSRQHRGRRGRVLVVANTVSTVSGDAPARIGGLVLADDVARPTRRHRRPWWRCRLRHLHECLTDLLAGRECCANVRTGPRSIDRDEGLGSVGQGCERLHESARQRGLQPLGLTTGSPQLARLDRCRAFDLACVDQMLAAPVVDRLRRRLEIMRPQQPCCRPPHDQARDDETPLNTSWTWRPSLRSRHHHSNKPRRQNRSNITSMWRAIVNSRIWYSLGCWFSPAAL